MVSDDGPIAWYAVERHYRPRSCREQAGSTIVRYIAALLKIILTVDNYVFRNSPVVSCRATAGKKAL
jgi:hypothetical protein